jgi:dynein heavy chain
MLVLKAIRPDKITMAVQDYIIEKIGKEFIDPPTFNLRACYKDSIVTTPLIFVLSSGTDPVSGFKKFAEEEGMTGNRVQMISLGQG